jgi:exopolyphosphatase / guanosine-5'-triphosphate,3'-diphosphate pyrophosphatase
MARIFAAADIGSNTAHLLIAATDGELVMRIDNVNEWIALGEVVARQGVIPKEQADQLVAAVREFKRVAITRAAEGIYVFATEAMRAASNYKEVLKRIKSETGVAVEVIKPEREAEFSHLGVMLDCKDCGADILFEVGGGSAQVAAVRGNEIVKDVSLPIGTGRIIAETGLTNPCPADVLISAQHFLDMHLASSDLPPAGTVAVASGGVARGLWRALHPDGEKRLALEELTYVAWSAARLPVDRIVERFNVKTKRAGTLLPGALIYQALLRRFGVTEMTISEFGVREGAILEMARGNAKIGTL